jgi:hypothetical protein
MAGVTLGDAAMGAGVCPMKTEWGEGRGGEVGAPRRDTDVLGAWGFWIDKERPDCGLFRI